MQRTPVAIALLAALQLSCSANEEGPDGASGPAPRLILHNAAIYTLDPNKPWAEAVAVRGDEIVAVGSDEDVLALAGSETQVVDLEEVMLLPGLQDPHLHALEAGLNREVCFLEPGLPLRAYERAMRACAREQVGEGWVRGAGPFANDLLDEGELPIEALDRAVPSRPALVLDAVGHAVWVNSKALEAIGLDEASDDPPGGILDRDPRTGRLTGLLLEAAQYLARDAAEPATPDNLERAYVGLLDALETINRNGITSVSDAGGYWPRGHHEVWQRAEAAGTLTVRASNALFVYPYRAAEEQIQKLRSLFSNDADRLLRFNQAKIYLDGIPSIGSAALLEPYAGTVNERGLLYFEPAALARTSQALHEGGFQLHFHVTGDRAARLGLDVLRTGTRASDDRRHRMTHLYFVHPDDVPRFAAEGVIADFQIGPESSSADYEEFIAERVGRRARRALPMAELLDAGARVVLSSDWDAEPLAPFEMLQRGLQRHRDPIPDLATGLRMMTLDVAYALGQEQTTGSIEVGKKADLIAIDRNLFEIPASRIGQTEVLLTLLGGEEVFAASGWSLR
ncbi:MAG: amidohydrolase [Acidobacteriota bacterium]